MRRRTATAAAALTIAVVSVGVLAGAAGAQKGVLGLGANPNSGIVAPDGDFRYLALAAGQGTLVTKVATDGGAIEQSRRVDARLTVPAVAYDGSPGGLSADGRTLVLPEPGWRFPQRESRFQVFDTDGLRPQGTIRFDGSWTYDAISPNGRLLYLIEYTSPRDLSEYQVRAYDLRKGELEPKPIIDPNESGEEMYGTPLTRATSAGGRWAYTLYESAERDHPPFIHALDTERGTAVCIDLDALADHRNLYRLDLQPSVDGSSLSVVERGAPLAQVDLGSFQVSEPAAPPAADAETAGGGPGFWSDRLPLWALGIAGAFVATAASLILLRRRRERRLDEDDLAWLIRVDGDAELEPEDEPREREPVR